METAHSNENAKLKRDLSGEAVYLALRGNWGRAMEVNTGILAIVPDDVEALNRLGKAFLELSRYSEAREAFESAAMYAPYNPISKKNLERLAHLQETQTPPKQGKVVTPDLFIEDSGKSGTTVLNRPAPREVLAKMAAGDFLRLDCREHALVVENNQGEYIGQVEPKMAIRLIRLMKGGNRYDVAVVSIHRLEICAIIWETFRHPSTNSECSFPTRSRDERKGFRRDALLRYDIETGSDGADEYAPDWGDGFSDDQGVSDDGHTRVPSRVSNALREGSEDEEED